jgi:hypothetical protein
MSCKAFLMGHIPVENLSCLYLQVNRHEEMRRDILWRVYVLSAPEVTPHPDPLPQGEMGLLYYLLSLDGRG